MDLLGFNRIIKILQKDTVPQFFQTTSIAGIFFFGFFGQQFYSMLLAQDVSPIRVDFLMLGLGVYVCYFINNGSTGKEFALRFTVLFSQCIYIIAFVIVVSIIASMLMKELFGVKLPDLHWVTILLLKYCFELLLLGCMFWGFKKINGKKLA